MIQIRNEDLHSGIRSHDLTNYFPTIPSSFLHSPSLFILASVELVKIFLGGGGFETGYLFVALEPVLGIALVGQGGL